MGNRFASALPAARCLWDYDTLGDEKRGLRGVAGQRDQDSRFFYKRHIAAVRAKVAVYPDEWGAMENLAVAQASSTSCRPRAPK